MHGQMEGSTRAGGIKGSNMDMASIQGVVTDQKKSMVSGKVASVPSGLIKKRLILLNKENLTLQSISKTRFIYKMLHF